MGAGVWFAGAGAGAAGVSGEASSKCRANAGVLFRGQSLSGIFAGGDNGESKARRLLFLQKVVIQEPL